MMKTLAEPRHGKTQNKILSMIVDREFNQYYEQQRQLKQRQSIGKSNMTPQSLSSNLNKISQDLYPDQAVKHQSGGFQYKSSRQNKSKAGNEMQIVEEKAILPNVGDSIYSISEALSSSLPNSMHGVNMNSKGSSHLRESRIPGEPQVRDLASKEKQSGSPQRKRMLAEFPPDRKKDALRSLYSKISS